MTSPANILADPKLPHLSEVIDAAAMAERFAGAFQTTLATLRARVENCAIERVQYRPGRRCRVLYRLNLREASGNKSEQWFYGKLMRPGQAQREYEKALVDENLRNGAWQPVTIWPDLEMVVWTFPNDPRMPQLAKAVDPRRIREHIDANLKVWGLSRAWRCTEVAVEPVKYMPGKRCVLRCHAHLASSFGESRTLSFYSKSYGDAMSHYHFKVLAKVHQQLGHVINIPRPLLHWDETNTFWQEPCAGRPLIDVLEEYNWEELFPRLGRVLASFHQSRCAGLLQFDALEHACDSAQEDAESLGWLVPEQREFFQRTLEVLTSAKEKLARAHFPSAPIHGALRLEQIVAAGQEVALVDFDAAAFGDPLYDVAEFIASLQYLAFTRGLAPQRLARAAELFQKSYAQHAPWPLDSQRLAWYAVVSLLSKAHDTWKNLDARAMAHGAAIVQLVEAWSDGLVE